jgi:hypothetical protein
MKMKTEIKSTIETMMSHPFHLITIKTQKTQASLVKEIIIKINEKPVLSEMDNEDSRTIHTTAMMG